MSNINRRTDILERKAPQLPSTSLARPYVQELRRAQAASQISYRTIASRLTEKGIRTSTALIGKIMQGTHTTTERAEALSAMLGRPIIELFSHPNGDPIGGVL